jgi:hypothetical protein
MRAGPTRSKVTEWDERCSGILRRMAGQHHDREICASIAAETGKHFKPRTVAEYRRLGGLPPCRRNEWTVPLQRARGEKGAVVPARGHSVCDIASAATLPSTLGSLREES